MEALRAFLKGWVGKGLLIIFLLPLVITGFESIVHQGDDPNAVAKAGEQDISASALQNMVNQRRESLLESVNGDTSLINDNALRKQVLSGLIDRALLLQQAKKLGFTVSDASLTQMLVMHPSFQGADGKFSNEQFGNYLRSQGINKDQLFARLRDDETISAFGRGIVTTAIFANTGVERFIDMQTEVRPLWIARLDWQNFAPQVSLSDTEINSYYQKNKDKLNSEEMLDLNYLVLDKNNLNIPAPSDQEIEQQYQQYLAQTGNQTSYEVAMILVSGDTAKTTLDNVKQQLDAKKADFATLAKQYSQDEGSKNDGGKIGTISQSMFPNDFAKIQNALQGLKVGDVTAPIQTNYGHHLFQLLKINGQNPPSLDSVKDQLIEQINTQKRENTYQELIGKINNDAVSGSSVAELASRYHLASHSLKNYTKLNNNSELNQPAVIAAAFEPTLLKEGGTSVGMELPNRVVWLQPSNYRDKKPLNQAEATPIIKQRLTVEKAKDLALKQAETIAKTITDAKSLQNAPIAFQDFGVTNRFNPALLDEERSAAFSKPANDNQLSATSQITEQGASVIVGGKISNDNSQVATKIRQDTAKIIRDNLGQSQYEDYLTYLKDTHDVKIKQQNLNP
ncbi:PpiC-type peptidyl-prolyl cis-trans isomerase [Moraxella macacae 0408225]|uniref:Periplasmic chaperone PpiD n=1 Tax=Moraxella macacae 0408225 TaxID=1230338 RepID=L2F5K0_9GAMM|nr:SurA N-terminal domain-containing protein [Moraxella macacae]ELA08339.1 PpiC-type peptidyl-prolyl cis-trans isomerase [Moraxella macacae 0408225]